MIKLFLSYRREDSQGITGRIYDRLQLIFGHESVFMDVDSIPIGVDFRNHLKESVEQCNVFIAVIGDRWCRDDMKNRLEDPDDYVRLEIEYALAKEIPVIPVLIGRTTMPVPDDLPASIKMLAYRNAVHIDTGKDFSFHIDNLISAVKSLYEETFESNISRNNLLIKTHTSLFFVSNSKDKQEEYKRLLCIQDLKLSEIDVPDIQEMNLELIVRKKIDYVRPILSDAAFF